MAVNFPATNVYVYMKVFFVETTFTLSGNIGLLTVKVCFCALHVFKVKSTLDASALGRGDKWYTLFAHIVHINSLVIW